MPQSTSAHRIDDLELFADCTKGQLQRIRALTTSLHIPKDHVLMREGSLGREFIVIRNGSARITRDAGDGVARVADVGSGDFLGEMALLNGTPRTATATATTDLDVLVSSIVEFRTILEIAPSVAHKVRTVSTARASDLALAA